MPISDYPLPYGWCDWKKFERHPDFVKWAVAPKKCASRYAVMRDVGGRLGPRGGVRWAQVSPLGEIERYSDGNFYDDMPGGAVEAAARGARKFNKKVKEWLR